MIKNMREFMVRWKFRISYFSGFLTTFAGLLIIASTLQDKLAGIGHPINYLILFPIILILALLAAYILDRFGVIESEIAYSNSKNKLLNEIGKDVKK